ncbi:3-oxoadipate enol-lactonase [Bradyrhizobium sp. STM 3809]|uniref:3-oxoadipate enol-lactonase n=1 Tax=Bradyrhizobium sp. STM 3809 TaxID=551936 RepID=UPI000240941D|nr:3-oxoadipate enol-lactonase [Bradyrhizobium sp. STM 3809]CCE01953.1 3-oxoadipate enol-lactonase 2 (3-oxoadipate enol-lactonase II) (Enol-lactone hydrolase II) (Beta-ketoadipate enol-lactone hydrolase II) [Bradyrhizobium sp. STM 3809]
MPFVQNAHVTLFVTESGPADAPAILFSNSLGTTHRMWDAVVAELSSEFRCIRYDTRGHGASTRSHSAFGIEDLADDAVDILDNLGIEQAHFAGLSLGGMTGQAVALRASTRLHSLSLMATTSYMPPASAWNERAALVRREGTKAIVEATIQRWFTPGFTAGSRAAIDRVAREFSEADAEGYASCCEAIGRMDFREHIGQIRTPTLIIAGAQDPATPVEMSRNMHLSIPDSHLVVLDPAAHLLAVERPDAVIDALRSHIGERAA